MFLFYTLTKYYSDDQIKNRDGQGMLHIWGTVQVHTGFW